MAVFILTGVFAQNTKELATIDGKTFYNAVSAKQMPLASSSSKTVLFTEDFEGGALPAGWSVIDGACGWMFGTNGSSEYFPIPPHTTYAYVNDDACNADMSDVWLITPSIDMSTVGAAILEFAVLGYYDTFTIKYSIDGGTEWFNLAIVDEYDDWTTIQYPLNDLVGENDVKLAFHYNDNGEWGYGYAIDDIVIFEPAAIDMAVIGFLPLSSELTEIFPEVWVVNLGSTIIDAFTVYFEIGSEMYEAHVDVIDAGLEMFDIMAVTMTQGWTPSETGTFEVMATVEVVGDENAENDEMMGEIFIFESAAAIYEQHDLITHPGAGAGGADVSALQDDLGLDSYGGGFQITAGNSIADDFTVPAGEAWHVSGFNFFGYQTGSSTTSSFTEMKIRVYNGNPMSGGTVIHDFWANNSMVNTDWTGIYRTLSTDLANAQRPIMIMNCAVETFTLTPGTYWVEFAAAGTLGSGPWMPPLTFLGVATTGNALQNITGTWAAFMDDVYAQGAPFDVLGEIEIISDVNTPQISVASVYPNPSSGIINIDVDDNSSVKIMDITGRMIDNFMIQGGSTFSFAQSSGLYIIQIESNGKISNHKVMVK